jgi:phenylalanyl-tRNA synthetase beta subunit
MNMKEHAISLDEIGYTFTDASKTLGVQGLKKWRDLTFLKRSFYFHPVVKEIVAPIALSSIQDMVQWTKKKDTDYSDLKKTIATALRELGFHTPEIFRENSKKLIYGSSKFLDFCPEVIDYASLAFLNYGRDEYL